MIRPSNLALTTVALVWFCAATGLVSALADDFGGLAPNFRGIVYDGKNELLLSGYAWHDPLTYSAEARAQLNALAFGGGYARYIVNPDGSTEMLSAMVFSDSYRKPQATAGYTKYWSATVVNDLSLGLGYTAGFSRRDDAFHGLPEPILLPVATLTVADRFQLFATFIPPLPKGFGVRGDVALIFAGVRF